MTKIEKKRQTLGLTRRQLAEQVGVTERVIYYYENGREPKASILKKMAKVLKCRMEDLI